MPKATVMLGEPVIDLIIATVLFGGIFTLYGLPEVTTKAGVLSASTSSRPDRAQPQSAPRTCPWP